MGASRTYRPEIDGLRAVAVVLVLAFHGFPEFCPGGFAGVDAFFVISGFLITSTIQADLADGRFRLRKFYARRIRRLGCVDRFNQHQRARETDDG